MDDIKDEKYRQEDRHMAMMERPQVRKIAGGKCWEHTFERFDLKAYVPDNSLDGQVNNYGFRAPCLLVFEEE